MPWNQKYWDIVDNLYWSPRYLGLQSISRKQWKRENNDRISVPADLVNSDGPLYARKRKSADLFDYLHSQEEILNHIFNITFAIAPDALISKLFLSPLGIDDAGPFESIGEEIKFRYGWGPSANVTQPDGVFASANSFVGVEMKLGSSSWPEQIAKYVALMVWEETINGPKSNLGLIFIVPPNAIEKHWQKCGLNGPDIDRQFLDILNYDKKLPKRVVELFQSENERVKTVLDRLQLAAISWTSIRDEIVRAQADLDPTKPSDQTLYRLLEGFLAQLAAHRQTGITA